MVLFLISFVSTHTQGIEILFEKLSQQIVQREVDFVNQSLHIIHRVGGFQVKSASLFSVFIGDKQQQQQQQQTQ